MRKTITLLTILLLVVFMIGCENSINPIEPQTQINGERSLEKKGGGCATIQGGTILYSGSHFFGGQSITTGFDDFGYNYQGHMFKGLYYNSYAGGAGFGPWEGDDDAYLADFPAAESHWAWPYRDVKLAMKWNDAWISNTDCEPNGTLDRHNGFPTYDNSGAWLTNHQSGEYELYEWDVSGNWLLDFAGGTDNREFRNLVQDAEGNVIGEFWWLNSGTWEYGGTLVGTVTGDELYLYYERPAPLTYTGEFYGVIGENVITDGTFTDSDANDLTWTATGTSEKAFETCKWNYFVKIITPSTANGDYSLGGIWYDVDDVEIGPAIWGAFAVIQEVENDGCADIHGLQYVSPKSAGFGAYPAFDGE